MNELLWDWVHLPQDVQAVSLWDCLHDARLCAIRSDTLARSFVCEFDVDHLREHHGLAEGVRFVWNFQGVTSVRICKLEIWPGPKPETRGISREEESRLIDEYQAKWREVSISLTELEGGLQREGNDLDVADASCVQNETTFSLELEGYLDPEGGYHRLNIRAASLAISGSNGIAYTLEEFIGMGNAYWKAFAARKRVNEDA